MLKNEIKEMMCKSIFRFRENVYLNSKEITFQIFMKKGNGDNLKRDVVTNVIEKEDYLFLCGLKTLQEWKAALIF